MLQDSNKIYFLIYIVLLFVNISVNSNYLQIFLLTSTLFFYNKDIKLTLLLLLLWILMFLKKKEEFNNNIDNKSNIVQPDSYYIKLFRTFHITEKNSKRIVSKLSKNNKIEIYNQENKGNKY